MHELAAQLPVFAAADVEKALMQESEDSMPGEVDTSPLPDSLDFEDDDDQEDSHLVLHPRSERALYRSVLAGMRLWARPPDEHCDRCAKYVVVKTRIQLLSASLLVQPGTPEWDEAKCVVEGAGGKQRG